MNFQTNLIRSKLLQRAASDFKSWDLRKKKRLLPFYLSWTLSLMFVFSSPPSSAFAYIVVNKNLDCERIPSDSGCPSRPASWKRQSRWRLLTLWLIINSFLQLYNIKYCAFVSCTVWAKNLLNEIASYSAFICGPSVFWEPIFHTTVDKLYTHIITLPFQIDRKQNLYVNNNIQSLQSVWLTRARPVQVVRAGPGAS